MSAERDLPKLLRTMRPALSAGRFVFVSMPRGEAAPAGVRPLMAFHEEEGLTLIIAEDDARRAGLRPALGCRKITLEVHSSLEAVGFLAAVTARLAAAGIAVNAVSAYYHDHLFVPADRADDALRELQELSRSGNAHST